MLKSLIGTLTVVLMMAALARTGAAQRGQPAAPLAIDSLVGRDNFERYCASCHGRDARGQGPVAASLTTTPTDLTSLARRNGGTFPRERVAAFITGSGRDAVGAHGSIEMPVWGPIFRALDPSDARVRQRIDNLIQYLTSIQTSSTAVNDPGSQLFRTYCATCHGVDGRGKGPMADQLRRAPPDLTQYTANNGGVFPSERLRGIIDGQGVPAHGERDMPVWGDAFKTSGAGLSGEAVTARIDAIVRYVAGIQRRGA